MNQLGPNNYTQIKKLTCDFVDKKNYSTHYRMVSFYVRQAKMVDKFHEILSSKQSKWLGEAINFITQKRIEATIYLKTISVKKWITFFWKNNGECLKSVEN